MAMFASSLREGELPAWSQGFANYGYPLTLIAHQLPAYTGAILIQTGIPPETVFKLLILLTTAVSGLGMYYFVIAVLSQSSNQALIQRAALFSSLLWLFSSYRIMNIYSRGAVPEVFAAALIPFLLLPLLLFLKTRRLVYLALVIVMTFLLTITHPMMLLTSTLLLIATFISAGQFSTKRRLIIDAGITMTAVLLGTLIGSYYLVPLVLELKYFYQGTGTHSIGVESFLSLQNIFVWHWPYFPTSDHPGPRVGPIQVGIFELIILAIGVVASLRKLVNQQKQSTKLLFVWIGVGTVGLLLSSVLLKPLYDTVPVLASLQYSWRFLVVFHFATAVIASLLVVRFNIKSQYLYAVIIIIILVRLPEAYGKNFVTLPESEYQFNRENLHSANLNPVWVGDTKDYEVKDSLFSVVEGSGKLVSSVEKPSLRKYQYQSLSDSRISFNTFYFPGWLLSINNTPTVIEYQDPNYRGVMTTSVSSGTHQILLSYRDTKTRSLAKYISLTSIVGVISLLLLYAKASRKT